MNKSILSLLIFGLVLAMLHMPNTLLHLGLITGLLVGTVKLFWGIMQSFSTAGRSRSIHGV